MGAARAFYVITKPVYDCYIDAKTTTNPLGTESAKYFPCFEAALGKMNTWKNFNELFWYGLPDFN